MQTHKLLLDKCPNDWVAAVDKVLNLKKQLKWQLFLGSIFWTKNGT